MGNIFDFWYSLHTLYVYFHVFFFQTKLRNREGKKNTFNEQKKYPKKKNIM